MLCLAGHHGAMRMRVNRRTDYSSPVYCVCLAGPIVTLQFSRVSVCLCVCQSLERPGNELMVAAGTYGCFELAVFFVSSLQKEAKQCE